MNLPLYFTAPADSIMDCLQAVRIGCNPYCRFWLFDLHSEVCTKYSEMDDAGWSKVQAQIDADSGK